MGATVVGPTSLLDADPDLAAALNPSELAIATRELRASVLRLTSGPWTPRDDLAREAPLGLLVADGVLTRRTTVGRGASVELLGAGDILRPWHDTLVDLAVPWQTQWRVVQPARLLKLGAALERAASRWPTVQRALIERALHRSRSLSTLVAISHVPHLDERLLLLFRHLAERWGRVARDCVVLPVDLPQETLGELVHAQRCSVNRSLRRLREQGLIARRPDGWALFEIAPQRLNDRPAEDHGTARWRSGDVSDRFERPAAQSFANVA